LHDRSAQRADPEAAGRAPRQARRRQQERSGRPRVMTTMQTTQTTPIVEFLKKFTEAAGIAATVHVEETADGPRINLSGEEAELLLRHRGEPLKALQVVVDMAFGRTLGDDRRIFIDALEYRKGKDVELRQMAKILAE